MPITAMAEAGSRLNQHSLSRVIIVIAIAALITLLLAPYFYNRKLKKRGDKELSSFLMLNPETRDLILEEKAELPTAEAEEEQEIEPDTSDDEEPSS